MRITIAAVGKGKHPHEAALTAHYLKRTRWDIELREIADAPGNLSAEARRAREAESILKLMGAQSRLLAMDATGKSLTSPEFTGLIEDANRHAVKHLVFAIGGQDGLDGALLKRAHRTIAFGAATWPHQLLRAMLAEQLYRAYTITIGHPYHVGH